MITNKITDHLEALISILRSEQRKLANEEGLQLIHLQIIHYLGRCNRYSNTLLVLCDFLGQTKGTISTSVSLLEKKQLIKKVTNLVDKRKQHLQLTKQGVATAKKQSQTWLNAEQLYTPSEEKHLLEAFELLLKKIQKGNNYQMFGICHSCKHLKRSKNSLICGLTQEFLIEPELEQLCIHHVRAC